MTEIDPRARLLFEVLETLGWSGDAEAIAEGVRRLQLGLPAEDEFSVLLAWLGRCQLVHKLDQLQSPPTSRAKYRVPDLLAFFDYKGRTIPALIEVKVRRAQSTLRWRRDYLNAMRTYAQALDLPLLVAWKYQTLWVLFDAAHFREDGLNWTIKFTDALKHTLLGELAGDFSYSFRPNTGLHVRIRKESTTPTRVLGTIEEAYYTDGAGNRVRKLPAGVFALFASLDQEVETDETETHLTQSFLVNHDVAQFGHRAMVTLLQMFRKSGDPVDWRTILINNAVPTIEGGLRGAVDRALAAGFVQYGLDIHPNVLPGFLTSDDRG